MKFKRWTSITAIAAYAALALPLTAQEQQSHSKQFHRYTLTNLGTFGGTSSQGNGIDNLGLVTGAANLPGDETIHAAAWLHGFGFDLGTLGGPNSAVLFPVKSDNGEIAGVAETSEIDTLNETWSCALFFPSVTKHTCVGFRWKDGVMHPLPTLGGENGFAAGINNRGQVVGWAENNTHDPTCVAPQVLQFEAVIWGPDPEQIQQLPPYPGDTDSSAVAINDKGQVVGISGKCDQAFGRFSARHAVLWEHGKVIDLGNFGGIAWNTPVSINKRGDIVGFSDFPGDDNGKPNFHAFLKIKGHKIVDLKTLPGDILSEALGINERGQVVGISIGANGTRAFLWEDGIMTDLNSLLPRGTSVTLAYAGDINDRGEITGGLIDPNHAQCGPATLGCAFLATPKRDHDRDQGAGLR